MRSKRFLSIEQMKHLQVIGINLSTIIPFTLQDIFDMLPSQIDTHILNLQKKDGCWICFYMENYTKSIVQLFSERECIDAAYNMLCWVIENKYLEFSNNE